MVNKIISWFRKEENEHQLYLPSTEEEIFVLMLENIEIGYLECKNGMWKFYYSEIFKTLDGYYSIPGFSELNKIYSNETLWPFFQIRIPGLGQPAIKDILKKEKIDKENELELLKRFGFKTISNPYTLKLT